VPGAPASFDRSFSAASGAMRDQGLTISAEDRNAGRIVGKAGDGTVTANVRQQADGSVVIPEVLRPWVGKDKIEPKKK